MNRNTELHFSQVPGIETKRSRFEESHSIKTTMDAGSCIPVFVDCDILPGDTVQMDMAELIRMATPIYPIMDNVYADVYWFFVPHRLVWDHWQAFWGENDDPWTQTTPYEIPQIEAPTGGWTEGTIADYMGIPTKIDDFSINALPFRAYCKIWNDWFRDENLKSNCHIYTDETTRTGQTGAETGYSYVTGAELGGAPLKAAKFHDYFTACLPQPQKGDPVQISIDGGAYPVLAGTNQTVETGTAASNIHFKGLDANGKVTNTTPWSTGNNNALFGWRNGDNGDVARMSGTGGSGYGNTQYDATPVNLYADLSNATIMTINQLRTAFAIQKYYENAGLHGRAKACAVSKSRKKSGRLNRKAS